MQQSHEQQQEELQVLQEELLSLRQQREMEKEEQGQQDQEALALLAEQAEQMEESARQLAVKLQEKVSIRFEQLNEILSKSHEALWCYRGAHILQMLENVLVWYRPQQK